MAGFLDKNNRVIDMVLTGHGKDLLAKGELKFVYWVPFDDEVDYDPYIANSASLSDVALSASRVEQIEATLIREATTGYKHFNRSGSDHTNVYRPMFDMPQGQTVIPRMTGSAPSQINLEVSQRKVADLQLKKDQYGRVIEQVGPFDKGIERMNATNFSLEYKYVNGSFPKEWKPEGFLVRVFRSGTDGFNEVKEKRDAMNDLSYNNDLKLFPGSD